MNQYKLAFGPVTLALLLAGCTDLDMAEDDESGDGDEETSTVEQASWTTWYNMSNDFNTAVVRVCKTTTRINWEFGYNTFTRAQTGGGGLSYITSNIAGQNWGSRYRTRGNASSFEVYLGTEQAPNVAGLHLPIGYIPNC